PAAALRLTDPSVSRRHVALELRAGRLIVVDLDSTNGTYLGGVGIGEVSFTERAELRLGASTISVEPVTPSVSSPPLPNKIAFGAMLGVSPAMRRLYPLCERLARTDLPVIIEGETGTGKEVLANALHQLGPRARQPFVVFDCTAVPANLVEALLFGHERGAFTGAAETRQGVFERAQGGTLLIDEIGDLDLSLQPKLLGVLERSAVQRVGSAKMYAVDVRVIAATRRDLDREVQAGRFRDDLYHRLAVARVELPPLRRRREDIAVLARHFLRTHEAADSVLSQSQMNRWMDHDWPGNVRELRNAVAREVALGDLGAEGLLPFNAGLSEGSGLTVDSDGGVDWVEGIIQSDLPLAQARRRLTEEFERRYVERLLEQHGGNVKDAAAAAGVAKRYFQLVKSRAGLTK
ncbi:MAG TPA: sigma 54-interacting transcriptional regulator, partial [Polyangiaceae bacterium]|nr:sigma 54-interacting transcriptional regulator [Polyangiaceae bacterium]